MDKSEDFYGDPTELSKEMQETMNICALVGLNPNKAKNIKKIYTNVREQSKTSTKLIGSFRINLN